MSSSRDRRGVELLALGALAVAPWLPPAAGAALGVAGLALGTLVRPTLPPRERRVVGYTLLLAVLLLAGETVARWMPPGPAAARTAAMQAAFGSVRQDLERDVERAATLLGAPGIDLANRRHDFELLATVHGKRPERTWLLFDPDGELAAWIGPGLLQRVDASRLRSEPRGFVQGALSATLYVSRPLDGGGERRWRLASGESFRRDGPPPGSPETSPGVAWSLATEDGGTRLRVELPATPPARETRRWHRLAIAAAAFGFALLAVLRGSSLLLLAGAASGMRRPYPAGVIAIASVALALAARAAGASTPWALAVAVGVAGAGAGWQLGSRSGGGAWRLLPALLVPAALVFAGSRLAPGLAIAPPALFGSAEGVALRMAVSALALGALLLARGLRPATAPAAALWLALAVALVSTAASDRPVVVAIGGAVALALAALGLPRRGRGAPGRFAGAALLAMLVAAGAWEAGAHAAVRTRVEARLPTLLPPSPETMAAVEAQMREAIATAAPPLLEREGGGGVLPADLALAFWRRSPLERRDALSALAIVRDDGEQAAFSYGLPLDAQGAPDLGPVRWVDLDPPAWIARRVVGEQIVRAAGHDFTVRWALVPRPGFGPAAPPVAELAAALLRGGAAQVSLSELVAGAHAAIYDKDGRPQVTPWIDGTPRLDAAWSEAVPFSLQARTPDGPARVAAVRGDGVAAALFVPREMPLAALERAGSFAGGALLLTLALALAALAAVLPRGAMRDLVRRWLRSYSKRLVVVFSVLLLAPLLVLYGLFSHALSKRLAEEQESAALDAMRSAQRVLGEYVLSLEPGFGVGTALDDRLFEWLARVIHHEINLYWGSDVYASSKRDLFTAGLLPRRIPGRVWERIVLDGERVAQRAARIGTTEYLELYAPLEVPGVEARPTRLVLALPLLAQQEELDAEAAAVRRRALLMTLALSALLAALGSRFAARFTRPIEAIVAGTRRIADGAPALDYRPDEVELEALADAIDRMAGRIAESRERLVGEKRLVERIVDNVTAAVVGLDRQGRVLLANRLARDWLGATPGEPLAASLATRQLPQVAASLDDALRHPEPISTRIPREGGARHWALVRVPIEGGEPAELVVIEDVTDVVRAQRLDAWLAMARIIAHEIKNPLTPIRLSAEHLREAWARDRTHFQEVFDRCTGNILAQVEELRRTASEFSLYSEIPRIERQPGDLRETVGEIVDAYRAAPPPGVTLVWEPPGKELAAAFDARLLGRALRNLIENAVRASASGGRVEVRLERRGGEAVLQVLDEGPGVDPALLERVLEPYFSTASGGTGLGLPIARRIAEEHGGSLAVSNRESKGFAVTVTIPLVEAS